MYSSWLNLDIRKQQAMQLNAVLADRYLHRGHMLLKYKHGGLVGFQANIRRSTLVSILCFFLYTHTNAHTLKTSKKTSPLKHELTLAIRNSLFLSISLFHKHVHTLTLPVLWVTLVQDCCCSIDWTRPSIAFKYSYLSEEELWSMNSGTSKDFLLIPSFPRYWRRSAIISSLLPLAISLCSEVRGLCRHTNAEPPRHLAKSG